jgi:hypothetical protein
MTAIGPTTARGLGNVVFFPAIWLMDRLRYASKFVLIGALLLLPFGWVARLQYRQASKDIDFTTVSSTSRRRATC